VLAVIGLALLAAGKPLHSLEAAQDEPTKPADAQTLTDHVVRLGFPVAKSDPSDLTKSDTAWEIEWELTKPDNKPMMPPGTVFRIRSAKFMWKNKAGEPQWITVARMLEMAEIYVPYDNGYIAFLDVHHHPFYITPARREFLGPNCVAPGELLKS